MNIFYCRRAENRLDGSLGSYGVQDKRPFAVAEAQPQYAQDRSCDIVHIALTLQLDMERRTLQGSCATTVHALHEAASLTLDAVALHITQVQRTDQAPLTYTYDGQRLQITFATPLQPQEEAIIVIDYSVTNPRKGLYFVTPDAAYPDKPVQVWTQCQDEDARYWFPCFDAPHDKATTEMTVTVPAPYFALSNGRLVRTTSEESTHTYHWSQEQPHVTYLMTLVVGDFSVHSEEVEGVPIQWYVQRGREDDAQRAFGDTGAMLGFFNKALGVPYPWSKYAQVAVSDFIFGGMENTTATTQTDLTLHDARAHLDFSSNGLVAHELAHQWFGNLVTCKHWSHAWLNEGFATYFEALFHEHQHGADELRYVMHRNALAYFHEDAERYRRPLVTNIYREPIDLFDHHLYEKGSLVLHMLRYLLGDTLFWRAMQHYLTTHQHQVVETVDLERAIEAVSGRNLQAFFRQWVYQGGYPEYEVTYTWDQGTQMATVTVTQQQKVGTEHGVETPLFDMPVVLLFTLPTGEQRVTIRLQQQHHSLHVPLPAAPRWLSVDPGNWVLKKLHLKLPQDMLITQLQQDPDVMGRIHAAEALGKLASLEAIASLRQALQHDAFWGVQAEVARILGTLQAPAALEALLANVALEHPKSRRAVVTALGEFKEDRAAETLHTVLQQGDTSYFVEAEVAAALGKTRRPGALTPLQQATTKSSWNEVIRGGALRGLAALQDKQALATIQDFTRYGQPPQARYAAIRALGTLGESWESVPDELIDTLTTLLDEDTFRTRLAVLDALSSLQNPKTLPALERLRSPALDGRIKRRLEEVIEAIRSGRKQSDDMAKLRDEMQTLHQENSQLRERLERLEARPMPSGNQQGP